jgi:putative endonuclease
VYSERHDSIREAIARERQLKRWTRAKKEALIVGDRETLKHLSKRRRKSRKHLPSGK